MLHLGEWICLVLVIFYSWNLWEPISDKYWDSSRLFFIVLTSFWITYPPLWLSMVFYCFLGEGQNALIGLDLESHTLGFYRCWRPHKGHEFSSAFWGLLSVNKPNFPGLRSITIFKHLHFHFSLSELFSHCYQIPSPLFSCWGNFSDTLMSTAERRDAAFKVRILFYIVVMCVGYMWAKLGLMMLPCNTATSPLLPRCAFRLV